MTSVHGILYLSCMRTLLTVLLVVSGSTLCLSQPAAWVTYTDSVKHAWEAEDTKLLTKVEQMDFKGVKYHPYDSCYRMAVRYEAIQDEPIVEIPTTRGKTSRYLPYATVYFAVRDTACSLKVFRGLDPWSEMDLYFVMFNDASNGDSSYGGGRYLELQEVDESAGNAILDFNFSYNPYCAYSERYSCPIPPKENELVVRIEAGVEY